jgi:glycosyltransferase involved in cell wall biosynthesis
VGSYTLKCAAALAAIGHEPHIFTLALPESARERIPSGVRVHEVADIAQRLHMGQLHPALAAAAMGTNSAAYKLLVGVLLCDALRQFHQHTPLQIVEAAEWESLALPLILHPLPNLPVVAQIHLGSAVNALGNEVAPTDRDALAEALESASIVGADALCAATQSVVDATRRVCRFEAEVCIIAHPVVCENEPAAAPTLGGAALFVGRLQRRKGCDVLAVASDLFLRANPDASVRIAGSDTPTAPGGGSMLRWMLERIDPAARDRFLYLGELSQAQVRREIEACRFQVIPSRIENFANTACDAMAVGKPVLYGGETGLDEVVGDAGVRVWPLAGESLARAMTSAWREPEQISELGQHGLQRVRTRFDPATVSRARVEFFERTISQPRRSDRLPADQRAVLAALVDQIGAVAGVGPVVSTPGQRLAAQFAELADRLHRKPRVWLFGAGRFTQRLLAERYRWESAGFSLEGVLDEHPRFSQVGASQQESLLGLAVLHPQQLREAVVAGTAAVDAVVLSTDTLHDVFRERSQCLEQLGIAILVL